ncbi:MAG TPA: hypothetical protein VFR77_00960, partial [Steroidobacteraceae bacterium]|nr:hypothetical protein [Steroidobacteraceae bacterium]
MTDAGSGEATPIAEPPVLRARDTRRPVLALRRTARLTFRPPLRATLRVLRATLRLPRRTARRAPARRRATFRLTRRTLRFAVRRTRRAADRRRTLLRDFLFAMLFLRMLQTLKRLHDTRVRASKLGLTHGAVNQTKGKSAATG